MPIPCYLAMTAAEFSAVNNLPAHIAWLACHFSPSGTGLSNLPKALPPNALLILDDHTPFAGHQQDVIIKQLRDFIALWKVDSVILDFERSPADDVQGLAKELQSALPCPVAAPPGFVNQTSPVFLPACPSNQLLHAYLAPFHGREIWLEAALEGMQISITSKGFFQESIYKPSANPFLHRDDRLHCHYNITQTENVVQFSLMRTHEDLEELLKEAATLGVTRAVGLWQELKK